MECIQILADSPKQNGEKHGADNGSFLKEQFFGRQEVCLTDHSGYAEQKNMTIGEENDLISTSNPARLPPKGIFKNTKCAVGYHF